MHCLQFLSLPVQHLSTLYPDGPPVLLLPPTKASSTSSMFRTPIFLLNFTKSVPTLRSHLVAKGSIKLDLSSYVTSTSISPTGAYFACGDADGVIHIHSQIDDSDPTAQVPFNGFDGKPIEWADTPEPLPDVHWTDFT